MLEIIVHGVGQPGYIGAKGPLGFFYMHQTFLERNRFYIAVEFRMSQGFVNVVEIHALG